MSEGAKSQHNDQGLMSALHALDQGDGLTVTMSVGGKVQYYYSNKIDVAGLPSGLNVEISSSEADDMMLLHHLLQETRSRVQPAD